jgi:undecaprenyl-diphosphatase
MSVWEALVLGIVQGITEFLPVSSSGHLVLLQKIFGISEPALVFGTAVHGGTLVAVIVVLRRDIWNILRRIVQPLTLHLIIATIPTVIVALLLRNQIEEAFVSGAFLGFAFLVTSAFLFVSDILYRGNKKTGELSAAAPALQGRPQSEMNCIDALLIGLFQAVAIIPGISRSGATISAALSRRLDRDFAGRFSFLLSIPAILGALVLQSKELVDILAAPEAASGVSAIAPLPLLTGMLSSCVVAFFSIRLTLKIVRERSLRGFALYTGILGLLVLADKFAGHFFF